MKEKFSKRVQSIIKQSKEEAIELGHSYVGSEHILLGLLKINSGKGKKILDIFPNDQEKYQYLIEKAKENDSFPLELRLDNFKVNGCQSQVWLVPEEKDEKLFFNSDSDALIAKGLVTLIASIYSDEKAEDIVSSEIDLMEEFELGVILSPARRNGAYSMLKTIKEYAKNLVS